MSKAWRLILIFCVILVVLFLIHPFLLGLPGRIHETTFEHYLHQGLTRDQVQQLSVRLHAGTGFPGNVASDFGNAQKEINSGVELIWFGDSATLCIGQGNLYHLHFGNPNRLESWTISRRYLLMAHTKHGPFVYACNRHPWGSPNGSGENYLFGFTLLSLLGLKSLMPPRKVGRTLGREDDPNCMRRRLKRL